MRTLAVRDKRAAVTVKSPSPRRSRGGLTTARWKQKFLRALKKTPSVKHACLAAGIARSTAYRQREDDGAFAEKWDSAVAESVDEIERAAFQKAAAGDPQLIMFLLKSHRRDVYGDVSKLNIDTRLCGFVEVPPKEDRPP